MLLALRENGGGVHSESVLDLVVSLCELGAVERELLTEILLGCFDFSAGLSN